MNTIASKKIFLGFGLGLRTEHYEALLSTKQIEVDWLEILTENYLVPGGKPLYYLDQICERYPIVMHGVSMSIGSTDALDWGYLRAIKTLAKRMKPEWISDHLCWTGIQHHNMHDLLPIPYTKEALHHVVERIQAIQDFLEQPILIENVSSYITYKESVMTEWDFLGEICERANCLILLDINNIYVSAVNHEFNPCDYLSRIPFDRVHQIHLAGHSKVDHSIIDTHDADIIDPVWQLYEDAIHRFGLVSTMIERDDQIPSLEYLVNELNHARYIASTLATHAEQLL